MVSTFATIVGIAAVLGGIVGMLTGGALSKRWLKDDKGAADRWGIGVLGGVAALLVNNIYQKHKTGGVVRETGMDMVHKGETIAGTQFGGRESNNLLRELIAQNATLMGKLTNKVSDLGLNS